MITQVNFRKVENGYYVDYWKDEGKGPKSFQRVFLDWQSLCDWLKEQVQ